jgi:phosphatidylserine/phosphatidylglycerophosphate/cardiolipin synthase-like enzyme
VSSPDQHAVIALEAELLTKSLPFSLMQSLAGAIRTCDLSDWLTCRARIVNDIPQPHYRNLATRFLDAWHSQAQEATPDAVSIALLTAARVEKSYRDHQSVEPVWTGPEVGVIPFRRTEQAILQVIDSATKRITVVSYAVYNIPRICEALVRAADRGCSINVVVETPDRLETQNTYNTLAALGPSVSSRCSVYLWPLEKRQKDTGGKPGILHVKCAVADSRWLFLSSANLTQQAFTLNMELGLLTTGGDLPGQIEQHFDRMIQTGVLAKP